MGGGVSRFAGSGTLKRLANAANLPLEVDDDISHDQLKDPGKVPQRSQYHIFFQYILVVKLLCSLRLVLSTLLWSSATTAECLHASV